MNKLTPEQMDALRLAHVRQNDGADMVALDGVDAAARAITACINDNRGHIGGIAIVIMAKPGSALVDAEDGVARDGVTFARVMNAPMAIAMERHLQDLAAVASRL